MNATHVIVLPGGGYAAHEANEAEPVVVWLEGLGLDANVFRYPLHARHPAPLEALRAEIRRIREGGATHVGIVGFSAGGGRRSLGTRHRAARASTSRVSVVTPVPELFDEPWV